jgi:two-component system chemotaxis sensor kinase CheA
LENEFFAVPLDRVERIERIQTAAIESIGERKVIQYRGGALPLCELSQILDIAPLPLGEQQEIIVFKVGNRELGLMATPPLDTFEVFLDVDESTLIQPGISGSMIIGDHTTLIIDILALASAITPEWFD